MTLEDYLEDQYHRDLEDIGTIEGVLREIARLFEITYDCDQSCWPLDVRVGATAVTGRQSQGTSAMILAAIGKMIGRCTHRDGLIERKLLDASKDKLVECFEHGMRELTKQLDKLGKIASSTFGDFDPLTISHLAELKRGAEGNGEAVLTFAEALQRLSRANEKIKHLVAQGLTERKEFLENGASKPHWCGGNGFVILRIVRAFVDLNPDGIRPAAYKAFFETRLHEQLSFSSIPDSRFDPAELAFCLEGLLICAPEAVDPVLFRRVFSVLAKEQETSAYWRPNRPFIAEPTGEILLPLSVEGANSLLRSIEIMDGDKLYGTFAASALSMFRRFWQWLRARKVEISALGGQCVGWHSEHVNEAGVIHLWDTSQVAEFLLGFRKLLQRHIAREALVRSRVKVDEPSRSDGWSKVVEKYEPIAGTPPVAVRVFDRVYSDFVGPWEGKSGHQNYSMLVFGPPGTGKTTIASSIANELGLRLITVTVSDFLGAGGAMVEARAKAIFRMLEAQSNCVIFFDEIDSFLLDRDSSHYRNQDTLFQFLTPGMLTKINELRKAARSIFIIATNYANRIDPAIKRPGRIDRQYLLLPPDLKKRRSIIANALPAPLPAPGDLDKMARESIFLGYAEINGAVQGLLKGKARPSASEIIAALQGTARSSSDAIYLARLNQETTFPEDEFIAIVELAVEAGKQKEVKSRITGLSKDDKVAWAKLLKRSPKFKLDLKRLGILA